MKSQKEFELDKIEVQRLTARRGKHSIEHRQKTTLGILRRLHGHFGNGEAREIATDLFMKPGVDLARFLLNIAFGSNKRKGHSSVCHRSWKCLVSCGSNPLDGDLKSRWEGAFRWLLTQCCWNVGDALLVGHVVETKDTVNFGQRRAVYMGWPYDSSLATEIDIVQQKFDELNPMGLLFDGHLRGGTGPVAVNGVSNKGGLAAPPGAEDQEVDGRIEI